MQLIDGRPVYSATDLVGYLACESLIALDRAALAGLVNAPHLRDRELEVLQKRGFEHEQRYLDELSNQGRLVVTIKGDEAASHPQHLQQEAALTRAAMANGADIIYQATFFDGTWVGHADFLLRVESPKRPSKFGPYHYEVADTKLARHVKASALLQILSYVDQLEALQGVRPERMHVVLGGNPRRTESFPVDDYSAYYRMVKGRFYEAVGPAALAPGYPLESAPDPVDHCDVCRWAKDCRDRRHADDHLSLVAGISRAQRRELTGRGVSTLESLAHLVVPVNPPPQRTSQSALSRVRDQAHIQAEGRAAGRMLHQLLPIEVDKGLAILPPPSPGDLFLDLEGDPYAFDNGLDYLFGVLEPSVRDPEGEPLYHKFWSTDDEDEFSLAGEQIAFEKTMDLIMDRLERDPDLHVYHYAPYEPSAFKRLMGRHGTREAEMDALLRGGVFVDLYHAVRQGLQASVESYSIKKLEPLYGLVRTVELREAGESIAEFEEWLELEAGARPGAENLDRILQYNRDDVLSTWLLRDWLEALRGEAGEDVPRPGPRDGDPTEDLAENLRITAELASRLSAGVDPDADKRSPEEHARWLLAQLLSWHRREEKASWWLFYHLIQDLTEDERIDTKEALGGLELLEVVVEAKSSKTFRYRFPDQEHPIDLKTQVVDPRTGRSAGQIAGLDDAARTIDLRRSAALQFEAHPLSLVPRPGVPTQVLRDSLLRLGASVADHGITGTGPYQAARDLLLRVPPQLRSRIPPHSQEGVGESQTPSPRAGEGWGEGEPPLKQPGEDAVEAACRLVLDLDDSVLAIQGPPGSGKTYTGGHMIAALIAAGHKVGITANSHKVISNLLQAACAAASHQGVDLHAIQLASDGVACDDDRVQRAQANEEVAGALQDGSANLAAGTAWLWARTEMAGSVDVLIIDEAGQFALANALAVAPAARSLVLLGDPQQLDQPSQGVHPPGAEASTLGHLLNGEPTMPLDRGLFLESTRRLHPNVCTFTSEAFYEGRLHAHRGLENQALKSSTLDEAGLWWVPVTHTGNDNRSDEEAEVVARLARDLVEGPASWIDAHGKEKKLGWKDVLIVAPYNAQVAAINRLLPKQARVGTVDKFQGQEAPVSIYSMATSTPEEAPRGMPFLYSRNRLNVATSRARCAAIVVCSPELLGVQARTPQQMRLANALCQFVEQARVLDVPAAID
ncbi:MAG TPA: TM0106 family RecB-like putative nuclease [Chloroflexota bacterium]